MNIIWVTPWSLHIISYQIKLCRVIICVITLFNDLHKKENIYFDCMSVCKIILSLQRVKKIDSTQPASDDHDDNDLIFIWHLFNYAVLELQICVFWCYKYCLIFLLFSLPWLWCNASYKNRVCHNLFCKWSNLNFFLFIQRYFVFISYLVVYSEVIEHTFWYDGSSCCIWRWNLGWWFHSSAK